MKRNILNKKTLDVLFSPNKRRVTCPKNGLIKKIQTNFSHNIWTYFSGTLSSVLSRPIWHTLDGGVNGKNKKDH
jgi:hypothetical protein